MSSSIIASLAHSRTLAGRAGVEEADVSSMVPMNRWVVLHDHADPAAVGGLSQSRTSRPAAVRCFRCGPAGRTRTFHQCCFSALPGRAYDRHGFARPGRERHAADTKPSMP